MHPRWAIRAGDLADRELRKQLQKHLPRIAVALDDQNRVIDEWVRQRGLQITVRGGGRLRSYRDPRFDRFAANASVRNEDKGQQPSERPDE